MFKVNNKDTRTTPMYQFKWRKDAYDPDHQEIPLHCNSFKSITHVKFEMSHLFAIP